MMLNRLKHNMRRNEHKGSITVMLLPALAQALVGFEQGEDLVNNCVVCKIDGQDYDLRPKSAKYCSLKEYKGNEITIQIPKRITNVTNVFLAGALYGSLSPKQKKNWEKHLFEKNIRFVSADHSRRFFVDEEAIKTIISARLAWYK